MQKLDTIYIVDFGSQYTQLIARRIREMGVFTEVVPPGTCLSILNQGKGVILSGNPQAVGSHNIDPQTFNLPQPILGISLGMQLMNLHNEGKVQNVGKKEFGSQKICLTSKSQLFRGLKAQENVWMSQGVSIEKLAHCYEPIAHSQDGIIAAIQHYEKPQYGIQFHPEEKILENFIEICSCKKDWTIGNQMERIKEKIRGQVGNKQVISLVRGGLDSAVATLLCAEALSPERVHPLFIDNGLMREDHSEEACELIRSRGMGHLRYIDASNEFVQALDGVTCSEEKKRVIDTLYNEILEREIIMMDASNHSFFFCQGTLYTDLIDQDAFFLKDKREKGLFLQPNDQFFKDEVRQIGKALNIPYQLALRHPFPNHGLAVRILGAVSKERLVTLRHADSIYLEELRKAGLYDHMAQAYSVLLPMDVVVLHAAGSADGMKIDAVSIESELLSQISSRIIKEVPHVKYVTYDITPMPSLLSEWE